MTPPGRVGGEPRRDRGQRGSATFLMVGLMAVVMVLSGAGMVVAGYAVAAHRARAAADLAAVSAAAAYEDGLDGCRTARSVSEANQGELTHCDRVGDQVDFVFTVEVAVTVRTPAPGLPRSVRGSARAGPVR